MADWLERCDAMKKTFIAALAVAMAFMTAQGALAHGWDYVETSYGRHDASIRSETNYFVNPASYIYLEIKLIHLPRPGNSESRSVQGKDRIRIGVVPFREAFFGRPRQPGQPFGSANIRFKFDDGPWIERNVSLNIDGSLLYFYDSDLMSGLRTGRRLSLEADIRDHGMQQFQFDVAGLQWHEPD